ncbi:pentapeptide repeat-containing protein, partial [Streptomyces cellulosae]
PATGHPRLGLARFGGATFQGIARFTRATFEGDATFESATFQGNARFASATFQRDASFGLATFQDDAWFGSATFQRNADFTSTTFQDDATFASATFQGGAQFASAAFQGGAWFGAATFQHEAQFSFATFQDDAGFASAAFQGYTAFGSTTFQGGAGFASATFQGYTAFGSTTFQRNAEFESATFQHDVTFDHAFFERAVTLGPLVCAGQVLLSEAVFGGPVTLSFAARHLECRRTRWSSTAEVRLRYATVDFSHAVFEYPLTIAAEPVPFVVAGGYLLAEASLASLPDAAVRLTSLRGVDAAHLVLADVDLSSCLLTGTVHLDQIRLEGNCSFERVPTGMHWQARRPVRFTQRRTLAEEHHWRARQPAAAPGWHAAMPDVGHAGPAQLAPVYRALRKAFEDAKNEPGAADFYYGEMEMRRHDHATTPT